MQKVTVLVNYPVFFTLLHLFYLLSSLLFRSNFSLPPFFIFPLYDIGRYPVFFPMYLYTLLVCDHIVCWAKNKRMFLLSLSRGLFLACTQKIYFTTWTACVNGYCMCFLEFLTDYNSLTWNGGSLYLVANPHPCWPHAQSELPILGPFFSLRHPPFPAFSPSSPQYMQYCASDDIDHARIFLCQAHLYRLLLERMYWEVSVPFVAYLNW